MFPPTGERHAFWGLEVLLGLWQNHSHACLYLYHSGLPLCLCLFLSYEETSLILDRGPILSLYGLILVIHIFKNSIYKQGHNPQYWTL